MKAVGMPATLNDSCEGCPARSCSILLLKKDCAPASVHFYDFWKINTDRLSPWSCTAYVMPGGSQLLPPGVSPEEAVVFDLFDVWRMDSGSYEEMVSHEQD